MGEVEWASDPGFIDWARHVRRTLVPRLRDSHFVMSILPEGKPDVKFAVELGLSLMLDKPVVLVVRPGVHVPGKLALVADAIIEWHDDPAVMSARIQGVIARLAALGPLE